MTKISTSKADPFAKLRGIVLFYHEPTAPVGEDDWEALQGSASA